MVTQTQLWWDRLVDDLATELVLYKSVGSLNSFTIKTQLSNYHVINVYVSIREVSLHFAIFPNTLCGVFENIEYGERTASGYAWSVKEQVTAEEICWEIFSCIADREEEKASEATCLDRIRSYGFDDAYISSLEDDLKGIDIFVPYKGLLVPIQLKQSTQGQYEHKKHYPHIPSLVYSEFNK